MISLSNTTLLALFGFVLLAGYWLYQAAIPTPLPGIPHISKSANRLFGDLPDLLKHQAATSQIMSFLTAKCVQLNSPIVQVFIRPFGRPWVIVADCRESHDIMMRRSDDFDRSGFFADLLGATMPHNQAFLPTGEIWRKHRALMADTMSPKFLRMVAAPQIHSAWSNLLELWTSKAALAEGRAFDVDQDISEAMMDTISSVAFGLSVGALPAQSKFVANLSRRTEPLRKHDNWVEFPQHPAPTMATAMKTIVDSSAISQKSPLGRRHHQFAVKFYPSLRAAVKVKDRMIKSQLDAAWRKLSHSESSDDQLQSAADLLVQREVILSRKESRAPQYDSPTIRDELFGFLNAGFDTNSTTIKWGIKFLTRDTTRQAKLRAALEDAFPEAASEQITPSHELISGTSIPYLDAFIAETLRCDSTIAANSRVAIRDTEILGYQIPKGTVVFTMNGGPSLTAPPLPVNESKRWRSKEVSAPSYDGNWDIASLGEFQPERWLTRSASRGLEFNPRAGPMHSFGLGLRSCFGEKLAHLILRFAFTQLVWNFEFLPVPEEQGSFEAKDIMTHSPQMVYVKLATPMRQAY